VWLVRNSIIGCKALCRRIVHDHGSNGVSYSIGIAHADFSHRTKSAVVNGNETEIIVIRHRQAIGINIKPASKYPRSRIWRCERNYAINARGVVNDQRQTIIRTRQRRARSNGKIAAIRIGAGVLGEVAALMVNIDDDCHL